MQPAPSILEWRQVRAVRRRHRWRLIVAPTAAVLILSIAWMFGIGHVFEWLERSTGFDIWASVESLPSQLDVIAMLALGMGVPFVVAPTIGIVMVEMGVRRISASYRETPLCPFCAYDLSANAQEGDVRTCPECGETSTRFDAKTHWWSTMAPRTRET